MNSDPPRPARAEFLRRDTVQIAPATVAELRKASRLDRAPCQDCSAKDAELEASRRASFDLRRERDAALAQGAELRRQVEALEGVIAIIRSEVSELARRVDALAPTGQ